VVAKLSTNERWRQPMLPSKQNKKQSPQLHQAFLIQVLNLGACFSFNDVARQDAFCLQQAAVAMFS